MISFFQIIINLTVVQLFLMWVFLITRKNKVIHHKYLSAFLLTNLFFLLGFILFGKHGYLSSLNFIFFRMTYPFRFLFAPFMYLYITNFFKKKGKKLLHHWPHFIPFFIDFLMVLFLFTLQSPKEKIELINRGKIYPHEFKVTLFFLFHSQIVIYSLLSIKKIMEYTRQFRDYFSSLKKISLSWLKMSVIWFLLMWGVDFVNEMIMLFFHYYRQFYLLMNISVSINLIYAVLIVYKSMKYPALFSEYIKREHYAKYEKSGLTEELKERYLKKVNSLMISKKPFLNFSVTLPDISQETGISQNYISQIINEKLNKNFYDFINEYRVEEAKNMLSDPSNKKSILYVLNECGFNSKSAFYAAFKKETGLTPRTFRIMQSMQKGTQKKIIL